MRLRKYILITLALLLIGCKNMMSKLDDKIVESETPPTWAQNILSRSVNLNSLVGNWEYSSVVVYDNSDCSGDGEGYDYFGSIIYGETEATRSYNSIYSYSDFTDKLYNYSIDDFRSDCAIKDGTITSEGNCKMTDEDTLEYYLVDGGGYCEVYAKADMLVTYCGSIIFEGNTAKIFFTWNSDNSKWEDSGCKVIQLSSN